MQMRRMTPGLVVLMWMLLIHIVAAADWPRFRGSPGAGVSHNAFASDETMFNATPAISRGQLLLRSGKAIYCLGTKGRGAK